MPPEQVEVRRWLEKAQHDWAVARKAISPPGQELDAAFHCQQAIEKTLRAYRVAHAIQFEKVHDLARLLTKCATIDGAFLDLRDAVRPWSLYAVAFRYPGPADPTLA